MILGVAHLAIEVDDIQRSAAALATAGWRTTVLAHGVTLPPLGSDGYPSDAGSLDLAVLAAGESVVGLELTTHASSTRSVGHYALVLGPSPREGSNASAATDVVAGNDVAAALAGSAMLARPRRIALAEVGVEGWVDGAHSPDWAALAFAEAVPDAAATSAFWRALVGARAVAEGAGWSRMRLFAPFRTAAADLLVVSAGDGVAEPRARIDGQGAAGLAFLSTDVARDLAVAEDAGAVVLAGPGILTVAGRRFEVAFLEAPGGGCVELLWPLDDR